MLEVRLRAVPGDGCHARFGTAELPVGDGGVSAREEGWRCEVDRSSSRAAAGEDAGGAGGHPAGDAAAEAGLTAAREALREGLTVEELRGIVRSAVEAGGLTLGEFTVGRGPQTATGHGPGSGPIRRASR